MAGGDAQTILPTARPGRIVIAAWIPTAAALMFFFAMLPVAARQEARGATFGYKAAGKWLREHTSPGARIMTPELATALYAERVRVPMPDADWSDLLRFAGAQGVTHIVIQESDLKRESVRLAFLADTAALEMEPVFTFQATSAFTYVFRISKPASTPRIRRMPTEVVATAGPLRPSSINSRYFSDRNGRIVYLTGAHTWTNLRDRGTSDPPPQFDYDAYLEFLAAQNHNFMRLWVWELTRDQIDGVVYNAQPFPWPRSGPGQARDGKAKFDLSRFDEAYFRRLRSRVLAARDRGIYVAVMLFEGYGVQETEAPWRWYGHPFNAANNINGVDGDPDTDGWGIEVHTLRVPAVTAIQESYVRKVIDTLNDLDNVLYEICNEAGPYSTEWQAHIIELVKRYQAGKPNQHPVGMTFQYKGGVNRTLFDSAADWISPGSEGGYKDDPPAADASKVIISDTDHLGGADASWVWKTFTRGLNPIYMDDLGSHSDQQATRRAMGHTLSFARRMNLGATAPRPDLASSGYCLADAGREYLVYLPAGGKVTVELAGGRKFRVEWFNPGSDQVYSATVRARLSQQTFRAPFSGPAVLYLVAER